MKKFTMEYEIDKKRLEEEGGYSYDEVIADLDANIEGCNLVRKKEGLIEGKGTRSDVAYFGRLYTYLKKQEWVLEYATKLLLIEDGEAEDTLLHLMHLRDKEKGVA
jgi:hypothetical protein